MRKNRKEYKDRLEKEIRRDWKEWTKLPSDRWSMGNSGEYVELEKPIQDGYDLVLRVDLKESDERKRILEECYSVLYTPIHSSGIEFRKCDCRKSMIWNSSYPTFLEHSELDYFFTKGKLDFGKVKYCVRGKISDYVYERLSDAAKKYFTKCDDQKHCSFSFRKYSPVEYKFFDEDRIPFRFEVRPHYITHKFVPNNEIISRRDFLSKKVWDSQLWYTEVFEGYNRSARDLFSGKARSMFLKKMQAKKDFEDALQEMEKN